VFDMDGTIALGDAKSGGHKALPHAVALLETLERRGIPFVVFTNGTAKAPADYAASLRAAGFPVSDAQMLTPSASAAAWFVAQGMRRVRVLGNAGCAAPLRAAGLEVIDPAAPAQDVEAVYTGWFREFDFAALEAACDSLWHGARLFTASNVPFFATATGRAIGSSFAINAMLTAMTGKRARILGKPSRVAFDVARQVMGLPAARCGRWSWWATIRPWKCAWPMPPARSPWG
jgi:NagD protein